LFYFSLWLNSFIVMKYKVFKFGGASVKDAEHIKNVLSIIRSYDSEKILVVISALGKTTNALESKLPSIAQNPEESHIILKELIEDHLDIGRALNLDAESLANTFRKLTDEMITSIVKNGNKGSDFIYDQVISLGELFSTKLIENYMSSCGVLSVWQDVRELFQTDNVYKRAKMNMPESGLSVLNVIPDLFSEKDIIITQGFIARSAEGFTTTLGREGSDYTAALFAYFLDAGELTIWKDVPGILTADPKRFENVEKLDRMSYREAIEMTYYGAKVIHPKTIQPIQNKGIRLMVNSYLNPGEVGTIISGQGLPNYPPIVVIEDKVCLLQISSNDFSFIQEDHLSHIFNKLNESKIKLLTMRNSAISFTLCVKDPGHKRLNALIDNLGDYFTIDVFDGLQLITVRHFQENLIKNLTKNKVVLFEEILKNTIQLVVKPSLELKEKS
ncbi:MAG: aspartate kinase, partial [Bacteroidia bacterium]|nr:aspartate kinase [Bacteroidia bacterium]